MNQDISYYIQKIQLFQYLPYIFLIFMVILIFIIAYIRIKYGFWVSQPVFHVYDLNYILFPPGIIQHDLPEKNKYTNFKNIETIIYTEVSDIKISKFINFIKVNYLQNKENIFVPKKKNVLPYFTSHNDKSFWSFYTEDILIDNLKKGTTIDEKQIIGLMTSRSIFVSINRGKEAKFIAYYVDYLCVDKAYRKQGIAPQIIQTHHYNQRHLNKNIHVSLFKREDELTGIVPLCVYSTYGFNVDKWTKPPTIHAMYKVLEITQQNFQYLYEFIKINSNQFDIIINTESSNIIELIKTKNIFINVIMIDNEIICAYFFRKSCTFIEKGMEVLTCFASINNCKNNDIFIHGFKISFWDIANKNYFGFSAIESLSHNDIIIKNIEKNTKPLIISPTAYFFYNFAYPTFDSKKVLIIC